MKNVLGISLFYYDSTATIETGNCRIVAATPFDDLVFR